MIARRALLLGAGAGFAAPALLGRRAAAQGMMQGGMGGAAATDPADLAAGEPFRPLPELDARGGSLSLRAMSGQTRFAAGAPTPTLGFNRPYLGPTIRVRRGDAVAADVTNGTGNPVSTHWHGLNVPSDADGGAPQSIIAPGTTWRATLPVEQPAATLWYHTHVHGRNAPDVWAGLAGALIVEDAEEAALGLPSAADSDDLVLILQDKRLDAEGQGIYEPGMMDVMHGYLGDVVLVNGQFAPAAGVPQGPVRLRLINASTSARHVVSFPRATVLIGVDQGLLPAPVEVDTVTLAPGERAEVVTDMGEGGSAAIAVAASRMGGMMTGMMGMMGGADLSHTLLTLVADDDRPVAGRVPQDLTDGPAAMPEPVAARRFVLQEMAGGMMGMSGMGGGGPVMGINAKPYDPDVIDFTARVGTVERWTVVAEAMVHPFHAHGVKFRIPEPARPEEAGWKDVATIEGTRDLLVSIDAPSVGDVPFMFHCHILEHEDAGMMGQFLTA